MLESSKSKYHLRSIENIAEQRIESSFDITKPLALMQQGLPAAYDYSDFVYVLDEAGNTDKLATLGVKNFRQDLAALLINNFKEYVPKVKHLRSIPEIPQLLVSTFDTELWNRISTSQVEVYKPAWNDGTRSEILSPNFPIRKKIFYKFDIKMFFQIKKTVKGDNPLTTSLENLLKKFGLVYRKIQGESRQFCGVQNTVYAGRFNDGVERPKDPYTFYLHCLVGYENPQHLGGSYLFAQKCTNDWNSIHVSNESLPGVIGRNEILQGSTIFSQQHCPRSHIRLSRIKDERGNPVTLHRESKTYTTPSFNPIKERAPSDNINPEEGLFFLAYHKNPHILEKMFLNQLGNNDKSAYEDGLLNFFKVDNGNILYAPNIAEITGFTIDRSRIEGKIASQLGVASLCCYHQIRWLKNHKKNEDDEELYKQTGNPYFLYSRAGYMRRMSESHEYSEQLNPPSPRIMRIISRTFSLWQDTWYYNRKQRQIEHLEVYLKQHPDIIPNLENLTKDTGFTFTKYKQIPNQKTSFEAIPFGIRNGVATYLTLGHILSTFEYGCRGPIDGTSNGRFGANTFHLEPEDVLAGGEANLTFGQGKYIMDYMTEVQKQSKWLAGLNLSSQSGIGHVVPYMEDIVNEGLGRQIAKFKEQAKKYSTIQGAQTKVELFIAVYFSLLGMQKYFLNYAKYAENLAKSLKTSQQASVQSLEKIAATMNHLANNPPRDLHEGAQLVLSTFICLHITGEPVSIGRLDYVLRKFAKPVNPLATTITLDKNDQDIIDSFWIKVGEKANFNKGFFEDHQKWGNLAMGGNSAPYPQGASFNQWGHQLTVGGTNLDNTPFYNSITVHCLRAARTVPVNAPCLGLRLAPTTPRAIIEQAAKAILAGGAHPILLNDEKIIKGLRQSGNYVIPKTRWDSTKLEIDGSEKVVPYQNWKTTIDEAHIRDFTSDGCHEFLIAGRSWFWLGGGCTLTGLEYVLNVGKSLIESGPRYINGRRLTYREKPLSTYETYEQLQNQYFDIFEELMRSAFFGELNGYSNITKVCPANLLNAFTANMIQRASDFHDNGAEYKLFCPQYTGVANLANSLWNIKKLVYDTQVTTLEEIRYILLVNWGEELIQPFVSTNIPANIRERLKNRCEMMRQIVWKQQKFGVDKQVTDFGLRISQQLSKRTRNIFSNPTKDMLILFKRLTYLHGSKEAPFGFQYLPGCGTFENYEDFGTSMGASFDGRKKGQTLAQDYSPQNFLIDKTIGDAKYDFKPTFASQIIENYTYNALNGKDPQFFSGAVLDLNIDENYKLEYLVENISSLAKGKGTNLTTVTVCSREIMEEARRNTDRDLLRFRMGGWSEFAVAMFPQLLEQHIRRVREIYPAIQPIESAVSEYKEEGPSKKQKRE